MEIACRIIKTAKRLGIRTVAVYSDANEHSLHVKLADEAIRISPPPTRLSYLNGSSIVDAAIRTGAQVLSSKALRFSLQMRLVLLYSFIFLLLVFVFN